MKKRILFIGIICVFMVICALSASLAWLMDETEPLENTFSTSNIHIELSENTSAYKMIPGHTVAKDPKVTVKAGSEACFLFVKIEASENFDNFMEFTLADGWTALDGVANVYYREVAAIDADSNAVTCSVLKDDQIKVNEDVIKDMMDDIEAGTASAPTLTFTAYAVQRMKDNTTPYTAAAAWALIDSD